MDNGTNNEEILVKALEKLRFIHHSIKCQDFDFGDKLMSELQQMLARLDLGTFDDRDHALMRMLEKKIRIISREAVANAWTHRESATQIQRRQDALLRLMSGN